MPDMAAGMPLCYVALLSQRREGKRPRAGSGNWYRAGLFSQRPALWQGEGRTRNPARNTTGPHLLGNSVQGNRPAHHLPELLRPPDRRAVWTSFTARGRRGEMAVDRSRGSTKHACRKKLIH